MLDDDSDFELDDSDFELDDDSDFVLDDSDFELDESESEPDDDDDDSDFEFDESVEPGAVELEVLPRLSFLKNPVPLKVTPTGWNTFLTA